MNQYSNTIYTKPCIDCEVEKEMTGFKSYPNGSYSTVCLECQNTARREKTEKENQQRCRDIMQNGGWQDKAVRNFLCG